MRVVIADDHPLFRDGLRSLREARGLEATRLISRPALTPTLARKLLTESVRPPADQARL